MKKWILSFCFLWIIVILGACGSETAEDIYNKAVEKAESMESAKVTTEMSQEIESDDMSITMESNLTGEMIVNPMTVHQKGTIALTMPGDDLFGDFPMEVETETYLVDGEMYVYESLMGTWMKLDESMMDFETTQQPDVQEQLALLENYMDDFELEETGDDYIFRLTADEDGYKALMDEVLEEYMSTDLMGELGEISEILEQVNVNHLSMELILSQDSYDIKTYRIDMGMTINVDGEVLTINQIIDTTYNNINTVDAIEVPQEVKDQAIDEISM